MGEGGPRLVSELRISSSKAEGSTFWPPVPSTIFPLRLSTTLAWNNPPKILSKILPSPPQTVVARIKIIRSCNVLSKEPQKGKRIAEVTAIVNAPNKPASIPVPVTPPFVPGGTTRNVGDVMRRGFDLERMPSSEENVSAATAA
jgi:hypothetical protein